MIRTCSHNFRVIPIAVAALFIISCTPQQHPDVALKILETSDVHGSIFPYDFINDRPSNHSLAQVFSYVQDLRSDPSQEVVLLDNGDILQGQPTVYYSNFEDTTRPHICSRVMNYMQYDAGTVGNHDIEAGHSVYDKLTGEFDFPWMAANAVDNRTGKPYFKPYVIIKRKGIKIAVFGMITPGIPKWLPQNLWEGITFNDMVETAKTWVPVILEKEKPDVLVGLFHSGHDPTYGGSSDTTYRNENASLLVAKQVPGFDVIFIGHDHDEFDRFITRNDSGKVLVLDPRSGARLVSEATVHLTWNPSAKTYNKEVSGRLVSMKEVPADSTFLERFAPDIQVIRDYVSRPVGSFTKQIQSSGALFGDDPFMDLIHSVQLELTGAQISFAAPLSMNAVIGPGKVYVRDMFRLYRFENFLYTMEMSGQEIHDYLEYSYDNWMSTMTSATGHLLNFKTDDSGNPVYFERSPHYRLNTAYYNFDSAEGIDYTVDVSKSEGSKVIIHGLTNGSPFDINAKYLVAVNSYRGNGGGGHFTKGAGIPKTELAGRLRSSTGKDLRFYMIRWMEQQKSITPGCNENWNVIPVARWQSGKKRDFKMLFDK